MRDIYTELQKTGTISEQSRAQYQDLRSEMREQVGIQTTLYRTVTTQYTGITTLGRGLTDVGRIAKEFTQMITQLNVAEIRITEAQTAYNQAVSQYGASSKEAQDAMTKLNQAQTAMKQLEATMIMQIPMIAMQFVQLAIALQKASLEFEGLWASAMGPLGIGLIGLTAISTIAGIGMMMTSSQTVPSGQTAPGEVRSVARSGMAMIHAPEKIVNTGGGGLGGGVSVGQINVNMRPDGESPEQAGKTVTRMLRHLTTNMPYS